MSTLFSVMLMMMMVGLIHAEYEEYEEYECLSVEWSNPLLDTDPSDVIESTQKRYYLAGSGFLTPSGSANNFMSDPHGYLSMSVEINSEDSHVYNLFAIYGLDNNVQLGASIEHKWDGVNTRVGVYRGKSLVSLSKTTKAEQFTQSGAGSCIYPPIDSNTTDIVIEKLGDFHIRLHVNSIEPLYCTVGTGVTHTGVSQLTWDWVPSPGPVVMTMGGIPWAGYNYYVMPGGDIAITLCGETPVQLPSSPPSPLTTNAPTSAPTMGVNECDLCENLNAMDCVTWSQCQWLNAPDMCVPKTRTCSYFPHTYDSTAVPEFTEVCKTCRTIDMVVCAHLNDCDWYHGGNLCIPKDTVDCKYITP